jgi:circadian clock protein KaiC
MIHWWRTAQRTRPTMICGIVGCSKPLIAMQFVAFEETDEDLAKNFASLDYNLGELAAKKKILIDYIHIDISVSRRDR